MLTCEQPMGILLGMLLLTTVTFSQQLYMCRIFNQYVHLTFNRQETGIIEGWNTVTNELSCEGNIDSSIQAVCRLNDKASGYYYKKYLTGFMIKLYDKTSRSELTIINGDLCQHEIMENPPSYVIVNDDDDNSKILDLSYNSQNNFLANINSTLILTEEADDDEVDECINKKCYDQHTTISIGITISALVVFVMLQIIVIIICKQ